jgi:hypothetical protein
VDVQQKTETTMKRGILLILGLLLLFDIAGDDGLGKAKMVSHHANAKIYRSFSQHSESGKVGFIDSLPSSNWPKRLSLRQSHPVMHMAQFTLETITSCNNGGSGGNPR